MRNLANVSTAVTVFLFSKMEHYKQQMRVKIKEGVAAFSEKGSEGN